MGKILRLAADRLDGSEITTVPPHQIGVSEAFLAENTDPRDLQGAATRNGRTQHGVNFVHGVVPSPSADVYGLRAWTRDAGTTFVVAHIGSDLYDASAASWALLSASVAITAGEIIRAEPLNNILVIVVDGVTPKQFSGGAVTILAAAAPAEAKYAAIFASKLFLAGDDANPQTKTFSAANAPTDFVTADDAGSITTQDGGGDTIQGLAANNKILLTFYRNHVDALLGDSTFNFREERLINRGLCSKTGYVSVGEVVFFASDDAIYMVAGTTISDLTSARIRNTWRDISDKSQITLSVKGDLLLAVDYANDRAYACAYKHARWAEWTGQDWRTMDTGIDQTLYAGAQSGGSISQIWKLDSGSLDGAATVTASWRTGNYGFGWDDAIKDLRSVRLHAKPGMGTVTITCYKNGASTGSQNTVTFGTAGQHDWNGVHGQAALRGNYLGFKASWAGPGTLYGWAMYAELTTDGGTIPVET